MWLFTEQGFFSVTVYPEDESLYQMRARERADLEQLIEASGVEAEIIDTPRGDYGYRILIPKMKMMGLVNFLTGSIDYRNFKSAVGASPTQKHKVPAYMKIWGHMRQLQDDERSRPKAAAKPRKKSE